MSLSLEQQNIRFIAENVISLAAAVFFRTKLSPSHTSPTTRHVFGAVVGVFSLYWMIGWPFLHIVLQTTVVHAILLFVPQNISHRLVLVFSMVHLFYFQMHRYFFTSNVKDVISITFPMMASTQKLTALAFSYHDGFRRKNEKLSRFQDKHAISKCPSALEIFSYVFYFPGVLYGAAFFYKDYIDHITGDNYMQDEKDVTQNNGKAATEKRPIDKDVKIPSPNLEVIRKLSMALGSLVIYIYLRKIAPESLMSDSKFLESSDVFTITLTTALIICTIKFRFYFLWIFSEALQNAAGLGLHYVHGKPHWGLCTNIKIYDTMFGTCPKEQIAGWNIFTNNWLRFICYDRMTDFRLLSLFALNSFWHGVEPGYYVSFFTLAMLIACERKLRRTVRPYFLNSNWKYFYDILTWTCTLISMSYVFVGFRVEHISNIVQYYSSVYWWLHILLLMIFVMPMPKKKVQ